MTIRTPLRPTEEAEKVRTAILNLFPDSEITIGQGEVVAKTVSLDRFKTMIRNQRILDSIRHSLLAGVSSGCTVISLNKQAAFVDRVSLSEGRTALGNIEVTIESEGIERLIDVVAPRTVDGVEVK
ncbi:MAG: RNA-binding domain-containing protein [Methanomassiliicoccales archaeon]